MVRKRKYLTRLEMMHGRKNWRFLNWYTKRKRIDLPFNIDAVLRKDLRMISHRRVI